jgi:nucleotide-binding universal stress UspA family protein
VIHCDEFLVGRGGGQPVIADEEDAKTKIEGQVRELKEGGLNVTLTVVGSRAGSVPQAIADVAEELSPDVMVVGTRGHTALGGMLLGSVTQRLLHVATCPVFAVPAAAQHPDRSGSKAAQTAAV